MYTTTARCNSEISYNKEISFKLCKVVIISTSPDYVVVVNSFDSTAGDFVESI